MLKIVNTEKLIELGRGTRFGHQWSGKRCLANTRHGTRCKNPAVSGKERCRMHGGKSTGPLTVEGKARISKAQWKYRFRSIQYTETRKIIWLKLRQIEHRMRIDGLID